MKDIKRPNVLIIHGWLHSAKRYSLLAKKISEYADVDIYEFEGFGDTKYRQKKWNLLDYYVKRLNDYLDSKEYDLIITHSMGGNILLKVLNDFNWNKVKNVILSNTAYLGIPVLKPVVWMVPLIMFLLFVAKVLPKALIMPIVRKLSLLTVHDIEFLDDIMVNDVLRANPFVAAVTIFQLAFDKFKFKFTNQHNKLNFYVTYSEKDRVIPLNNTKTLVQDLKCPPTIEFKKIGHTVVLEAENEYYLLVRRVLNIEG